MPCPPQEGADFCSRNRKILVWIERLLLQTLTRSATALVTRPSTFFVSFASFCGHSSARAEPRPPFPSILLILLILSKDSPLKPRSINSTMTAWP